MTFHTRVTWAAQRGTARGAPAMRSHPLLLAIATPLAEATVFTNSATLKTKVVEWVDNNNCCDAQIEDWDVSQITDMSGGGDAEGFDAEGFFPTDFNGDLSKWDTASVTTFERTVRVARSVAPRASAAHRFSAPHLSVQGRPQLQRRHRQMGYRESDVLQLRVQPGE